MLLRNAIPVCTIAGVRIYLHWSIMVTLGVMTWLLADAFLPAQSSGVTPVQSWLTGLATAAALLLSLLAHELAHSIVARRSNVRVDRITLWMLGGASELLDEPPDPKADLRIAAAGPISSFVLGFAALATAGVLTSFTDPLFTTAIAWLGAMNIVLALFNLLPGSPLDGGRILRAVLWRRSGDRLKAATSAARSGQNIGSALILVGIAETLVLANFGGLWLMLLGWFLRSSANVELVDASARHNLGTLRVRDAMTSSPTVIHADWSLEQALESVIRTSRHRVFPVVDSAGKPVAVVSMSDLVRVPAAQRGTASIASVARALPDTARVDEDELLATITARVMLRPGVDLVAVMGDGRLTGILTATDLMVACDRSALGLPQVPTQQAGR